MEEKRGLIEFFKKLIKKEVKGNLVSDINEDNIDIQSINSIDKKEIIENDIKENVDMTNKLIEESVNLGSIYQESIEEVEIEYEEVIHESKDDGNDKLNSNIERVTNNMIDINKFRQSPCDITNDLNQGLLYVEKHLITQEQLANIGVTINLAHIENYEALDVAFKYNYDVPNPCGGTVPGEALLKAVVLVATVHYSWVLYDKVTKAIVYDGVVGATTAYSVYDIVKFDEDVRPTEVTTKFNPGELTRVNVIDDPNLSYYIFTVNGTVDLIGV